MMRRALISQNWVRLFDNMLKEKFTQMRFADACLTADEGHLTSAAFGSVPECQQLLQFLIATDKARNLV